VTGPATGSSGADAPEIVYLDVDDEITSAAARLRRSEAERVAFVLPYGSRLATSRINFRLLAREAGTRGKRLEIVAADPSARALAGSAGLTVYPSVAVLEGGEAAVAWTAAEAAAAGSAGTPASGAGDGTETRVIAVPKVADRIPMVGRRPPPVRTRTAVIAALVAVALLAVAGIGAFLYLPSATIVLTPTAEAFGPLDLTVQAKTDVTQPDATTMSVPARSYQFPVTASQTFTTTGTKVTEAKASGSVTFSNFDTGRSNRIDAGAIVATDSGIEFSTLATVTLPPASFDFFPPFSVHPSTTSVAVAAVAPGPVGNVGSNTITVLPKGENKNLTKVTNPDPTTGGTHTESPQISQQDVDAAMTALTTALQGTFDTQVRDAVGVPAGTTLFEETKSLGTSTPSLDPATLVGQQVATFDLALQATGTVLGVDPAPVTVVAEQQLASQVGAGWQLQPGTTRIDVGTPSVAGEVVTFPVTATATRARVVDHDALLAQIKGLVLAQARAKLDEYGQAQITLWPDWVSTIPTDSSRISLTIGSPAPRPSTSPGVNPTP
jgi:hypothetical protein